MTQDVSPGCTENTRECYGNHPRPTRTDDAATQAFTARTVFECQSPDAVSKMFDLQSMLPGLLLFTRRLVAPRLDHARQGANRARGLSIFEKLCYQAGDLGL